MNSIDEEDFTFIEIEPTTVDKATQTEDKREERSCRDYVIGVSILVLILLCPAVIINESVREAFGFPKRGKKI